jgi:hypothetical protein
MIRSRRRESSGNYWSGSRTPIYVWENGKLAAKQP